MCGLNSTPLLIPFTLLDVLPIHIFYTFLPASSCIAMSSNIVNIAVSAFAFVFDVCKIIVLVVFYMLCIIVGLSFDIYRLCTGSTDDSDGTIYSSSGIFCR